MNERMKELAEQAALLGPTSRVGNAHEAAERFAELVRQDEREACARTCEDMAEGLVGDDVSGVYGADYCAEAIRARGNRTKTSRDICGND